MNRWDGFRDSELRVMQVCFRNRERTRLYGEVTREIHRRQGLGRGDEAPPRVTSRAQTPAGVSPENPPGGPPRSIRDALDEFVVETPERLHRAVFYFEDVP